MESKLRSISRHGGDQGTVVLQGIRVHIIPVGTSHFSEESCLQRSLDIPALSSYNHCDPRAEHVAVRAATFSHEFNTSTSIAADDLPRYSSTRL